MHLNETTVLTSILQGLFTTYVERVKDVNKITNALIDRKIVAGQEEIINDHIAFRTLGVPNLGIASFEKIFLTHGYRKMGSYHFDAKKLDANWYAPPTEDLPRVFISELCVQELSENAQHIIKKYTSKIDVDPVDALDLHNAEEVIDYLHRPLWELPTLADYNALLEESEYAAWVIYNRYYLNHYTISVHELKKGLNTLDTFNDFLLDLGVALNNSGGLIKVSADGLLRQSSSVAEQHIATFAGGEKRSIAGSYVEFAERLPLPQYAHLPNHILTRAQRREGFETQNADKIFESTFTSQLKQH